MARFPLIMALLIASACLGTLEVSGMPQRNPGISLADAQQLLIGNTIESNGCLAIGEICSVADQCCSGRCPHFRSRCSS